MITDLTSRYIGFVAVGTGIVDLWAPWCGPCRLLAPVLEELSEETGVNIGRVNVDEEVELTQAFAVEQVPTLIFIKEGREKGRVTGYKTKEELKVIADLFLGD